MWKRFEIVFILLTVFFLYLENVEAINLIPEPQSVIQKVPIFKVKLDEQWMIIFDDISPPPPDYSSEENPYLFCAQELKKMLSKHGLSLTISKSSSTRRRTKIIILGNPLYNSFIKLWCNKKRLNIDILPYEHDDPRYTEGYILDVSKENILIVARGAAGIFYGIQTLSQIIDKNNTIKGIRIIDYPDMKWRGVYLNLHNIVYDDGERISYCLSSRAMNAIMRWVKKCANLKMNVIIFKTPCFHNMNAYNIYFFKKLFKKCRLRFITPIPSIHAKFGGFVYPLHKKKNCKPVIHLESLEGIWIQDEEFYFDKKGIAVPKIPVEGYILNGSFEYDCDKNGIPDNWTMCGVNFPSNKWKWISINDLGENNDSVHHGKHAMKLVVKASFMGSKFSQYIKYKSIKTYCKVIPNSYYELTFWVKRKSKLKIKLRVAIIQYDSYNNIIREGATFSSDFHIPPRWTNRHLSIFTHKECQKLKIIFKLSPTGTQEGVLYLDDIRLIRMNGLLLNVIRTNESNIIVKSFDKKTIYMEGIDYVVEQAPFYVVPPYEWDISKRTKIKLTTKSRIKKGDLVKVSYDCIPLNPKKEGARYCPSSSSTYKLYRDLFKKLLLLNPKYINIDLDEHRGGYNRDSRCRKRNLTNAEIFASFVNNLNDILHKKGTIEVLPNVKISGLNQPQIRLIMWDDMINYWHNGGKKYYQVRYGGLPGCTYLAMPATPVKGDKICRRKGKVNPISKNIIIACWWYRSQDIFNKIKNSPNFFETRGFDYLGVAWFDYENIKLWSKALYKTKALGLLCTTWEKGEKTFKGIEPTADFSWKVISKRF